MSQAPPPVLQAFVLKLDTSLGALFIGLVLSTALWGVGCAQAYWFYETFKAESYHLKTLVAVTWALDTVQQILIAHTVYSFTITNFMNLLFLDNYIWSLSVQSLFECLTAFAVQSFFVYRIWILSRKNYLMTIPPTLLVLAKLGVGIAYVALNRREHSITHATVANLWISEVVNAVTMASDITIAAFMIFLLANAKNGIRQSDTLINRLMLFTLNTGLITSICAVITLILAVRFPKNYLYGIFYFLTGKLYFNTMLASLNARRKKSSKSALVMMSGLAHASTDNESLPSFNAAQRSHTSAGTTTLNSNSNSKNIYYDAKPAEAL